MKTDNTSAVKLSLSPEECMECFSRSYFTQYGNGAIVLRMTQELENLFTERRYESIDEVINKKKIVKRRRGRKND